MQAISKGIELTEEAKVEAFETSENLPRGGRKFSSSGGSTTAVRSAGETRSGPSSFTSRQQEERARGHVVSGQGSGKTPKGSLKG
jgi:hypothetical protein